MDTAEVPTCEETPAIPNEASEGTHETCVSGGPTNTTPAGIIIKTEEFEVDTLAHPLSTQQGA